MPTVLLALPPTAGLDRPFPSIAFLARFLHARGVEVGLRDLGLELALRVFSARGLEAIFTALEDMEALPAPAWMALAQRARHVAVVGVVVRFLQGRDPSLARRLVAPGFLPQGPRLTAEDPRAFGPHDLDDRARQRATLYLEDLADLVAATVDTGFGIARLHPELAQGPVTFDGLAARLARTTLLDRWIEATADAIAGAQPTLVGLSLPFPGTIYGALRIGRRLRAHGVPVVLGGGWVSTELRGDPDPRLWDCADMVVFDDGEEPLLRILDHLHGGPDRRVRTLSREGLHDHGPAAHVATFLPRYADLPLHSYLGLRERPGRAASLWGSARWNSALTAHGCPWGRCAFCDTGSDAVARHERAATGALVEGMLQIAAETGDTGFHLCDEAASAASLRDLSIALLARGAALSFWGNVRFDRSFTPDLCRLLAAAGCVGVAGGLECAEDRGLAAMDKGTDMATAARALGAFHGAAIPAHAYLMHGFPGQTMIEVMDAAEAVRQLFAAGLLQSAYWHGFTVTRGSRVFREPEAFGIRLRPVPGAFATNDVPHEDLSGGPPAGIDAALTAAVEAWMAGRHTGAPVAAFFSFPVPVPRLALDWLAAGLAAPVPAPGPRARLIWIGDAPLEGARSVRVLGPDGAASVRGTRDERDWLQEVIAAADPAAEEPLRLGEAREAFPGDWEAFGPRWGRVRRAGLLVI
ncbi:MAG: radical SAM protein [Pseudomonadota bacterium]